MINKHKLWSRVFTYIPTPTANDDESIDENALRQVVDYLIEMGRPASAAEFLSGEIFSGATRESPGESAFEALRFLASLFPRPYSNPLGRL
jgi:hypothetical protein